MDSVDIAFLIFQFNAAARIYAPQSRAPEWEDGPGAESAHFVV